MTLEYTDLDVAYGDTFKKVKAAREAFIVKAREELAEKARIEERKRNKTYEGASNIENLEDLPEYKELPSDLQFYQDMKPGKKLRIVNDSLQVDNRKLQAIKRCVSGDSREKTFRYFETLYYKYKSSEFNGAVMGIMNALCETYSTDDKFITKLNNLLL